MDLNYQPTGATQVADPDWHTRPPGFRAFERTVRVGDDWSRLAETVMAWRCAY